MMVGKLTRYELKKSILNKFFLIIFCLFLALNVVLTGGLLDYLDLLESIATGPMAEAAAEDGGPSIWDYLSDAQENGDYMRQTYGPLADMTPEERTEFETAMVEKYGSDVFSPSFIPTAEMMTGPDYFGTDFGDFTYIGNYASLLQKNLDNQAAWDTAVNAAKAYGRDALAAGDNYGIRRNLQIIRLYSTPREEITSRTYNWEEYLFQSPTMLLVFLLVLLACAGSVTGERDRQTWMLLHTAKNGKGKTLLAKYLAGAITAAGLTVLFQLASLGAAWIKGGLMGGTQPVTEFEVLRMFPYPFTVWQYALLALGCQAFAAVQLSVLLTSISAFSKTSVISYGAGVLLLGVSLLLVFDPPRSPWLDGPLALARPLTYFSSYDTANLFGFPVLWAVVQAALWSIIGAVCAILAYRVYRRKRRAV